MDAAETARVYAFCCTTWRQRPSEAELAAWKLVLDDIDAEAGMAAAVALARTGREFMPAPGLIVEQVTGAGRSDHARVVGDAMWLPGTGWLGGKRPAGSAELDPPAGTDAAIRSIRSARSALKRDHEDGDR